MVWFAFCQSGQQTSVKFVEAAWNCKSGCVMHLKSPAFFFCFVLFCYVFVFVFVSVYVFFFVFVYVFVFFFCLVLFFTPSVAADAVLCI